jgi:hypothetical protein
MDVELQAKAHQSARKVRLPHGRGHEGGRGDARRTSLWRWPLIAGEGDTLILTPIRKHTLRDLLASWAPLEDALPEVEDLPVQPRR